MVQGLPLTHTHLFSGQQTCQEILFRTALRIGVYEQTLNNFLASYSDVSGLILCQEDGCPGLLYNVCSWEKFVRWMVQQNACFVCVCVCVVWMKRPARFPWRCYPDHYDVIRCRLDITWAAVLPYRVVHHRASDLKLRLVVIVQQQVDQVVHSRVKHGGYVVAVFFQLVVVKYKMKGWLRMAPIIILIVIMTLKQRTVTCHSYQISW
jgi:hypothetical protein